MVTQEEIEKMSPEEIAKLQKENCIFCKIINGQIPSKKVYEDDQVLAILDINPGRKGHVLIMPKEHYPILPLIPPEIFYKVFSATKIIAKAVKKAMMTNTSTIFLANGAVAGQQSPHFLFHIFPREENDELVNFSIKENPAVFEEQKKLFPALQNNLNIMLSKIMPTQPNQPENEDENKTANNNVKGQKTQNSQQISSEELLEKKQDVISQILDQYADVRNSLLADPKNFREQIKDNKELVNLFEGINLEVLSKQLKKIYPEEKEEENNTANNTGKENKKIREEKEKIISEEGEKEVDTPKDIEPFLGEHPAAQREAVFKYFESKPKAKKLLIEDPKYFKELLKKRPDVNVIFKDVDVDLLSLELKNIGGEK